MNVDGGPGEIRVAAGQFDHALLFTKCNAVKAQINPVEIADVLHLPGIARHVEPVAGIAGRSGGGGVLRAAAVKRCRRAVVCARNADGVVLHNAAGGISGINIAGNRGIAVSSV